MRILLRSRQHSGVFFAAAEAIGCFGFTPLRCLRTEIFEAASMKSDAISYPPRGLSREEAARYVGVGSTLFDEMVADGRMPKPKHINSRAIWDRVALDIAFTSLPDKDSGLQELLERSKRDREK
jgi:predicted DNA-binding transcriptional regulator AlpA